MQSPAWREGNTVNEVGTRLLQTIRLERGAFVWMDFNDRATGDALILVGITRVLTLMGTGSSLLALTTNPSGIELLLFSLINALVFWLMYSGLVYGAARFLFNGGGSYATLLRITGFAYPTLLLLIVTTRIFDQWYLALLVGSGWFLAIMTQGVRYESDLPIEKAFASALGGLVAFIIVSSIFNLGF